MATDSRRQTARKFVEYWTFRRGSEKGEDQQFWNSLLSSATLYHFGVLTSSVHMAWMRTVAGRLKSDYRYSRELVYNTFPWPKLGGSGKSAASPNERQLIGEAALSPLHAAIESTAQAILDARARYPESSLVDLYDPLTMPARSSRRPRGERPCCVGRLRPRPRPPEPEIVAHLFNLYAQMTEKEK